MAQIQRQQQRQPRSPNQYSWSLYNLLLLIRCCVATFLPGYIHPDEFFQGGQELWFGCPPQRPWEFMPEHALRSIVPPTVMTWWPLKPTAWWLGLPMEHLSGWHVWILPRVACGVASIIAVDMSIWSIHSSFNKDSPNKSSSKGVPLPVLLLASAWPTFVMMNRPFTNAMETWMLALLVRFAVSNKSGELSSPTLIQCILFGGISAIGIFTRFTFVCFAFPVVVFFGYRMLSFQWWEWLVKPAITCLSFAFVAYEIIKRDTEYYSDLHETSSDPAALVFTPWNAYSYNSKTDNLQEHGLHPLWTHALVNVFLLYGPMALVGYMSVFTSSTASFPKKLRLYAGIFVCGLLLLSSAPHQEPRFLLPLIIPLVLLCDNPRVNSTKHAGTAWVVFNLSLLVVFGGLHQAGVVQSLLELGTTLKEQKPAAVIFYHTYMPPTFLSRAALSARQCENSGAPGTCPGSTNTACQDQVFVDLNGSNTLQSLENEISDRLGCDGDQSNFVYVVTSPQKKVSDGRTWYMGGSKCFISNYSCEIEWSHDLHLTTDDFPSPAEVVQEGMPLNIYRVSCPN